MLSRRVLYFACCSALVVFFIFYVASEHLNIGKVKPGFNENLKEREIETTTEASSTTTMQTIIRYTTKEKPTESSTKSTFVSTVQPENYDLNRTFCSMKYDGVSMCPKLYTELGGLCFQGHNQSNITCTDVRKKAFRSLRQAQLVITRLLGAFDFVARKHNIKYWLTSGTLLGAVRHKGFIPWDTDADIEISLAEYEKFYRIASRDLPDDIFFQNSESDLKLRPSDPNDYKNLRYKDIGLYRRTWNPRLRDVKSCYKYCIQYGCKWHDGLMVDLFVIESVPKATLPLKEAFFEGLKFPIPNNWREVLIEKYGENAMEIPKEGSSNRARTDWPDPLHSCEEIRAGRKN